MKPRLIIFDLDGTLADTSPGILASHRYAHVAMGRQVPSDGTLREVIGAPLLKTYEERFRFAPDDARRAVDAYRRFYADTGLLGVKPYPGVTEALEELKQQNYQLCVATLKAERFAIKILDMLGVLPYFTAVYGMDEQDSLTKAQLIQKCMTLVHAAREETILVGDSEYDLDGAQSCGVGFIGVRYGFGFRDNTSPSNVRMCDNAAMLPGKIRAMIDGLV